MEETKCETSENGSNDSNSRWHGNDMISVQFTQKVYMVDSEAAGAEVVAEERQPACRRCRAICRKRSTTTRCFLQIYKSHFISHVVRKKAGTRWFLRETVCIILNSGNSYC
ncbi:hypothetical protein ABZP36_015686 [Zizania latifolia]